MSNRRLLTKSQVIEIGVNYANSDDYLTMSHFAREYDVSNSTISKYLRQGIADKLFRSETAKKIKEKSIRNSEFVKERFFNEKTKVSDKRSKNLQSLKTQYEELEHQIEIFETYSSSDEFPYSLDELQSELSFLKDQIREYS